MACLPLAAARWWVTGAAAGWSLAPNACCVQCTVASNSCGLIPRHARATACVAVAVPSVEGGFQQARMCWEARPTLRAAKPFVGMQAHMQAHTKQVKLTCLVGNEAWARALRGWSTCGPLAAMAATCCCMPCCRLHVPPLGLHPGPRQPGAQPGQRPRGVCRGQLHSVAAGRMGLVRCPLCRAGSLHLQDTCVPRRRPLPRAAHTHCLGAAGCCQCVHKLYRWLVARTSNAVEQSDPNTC